jgi:hypothetical protein
LQRSGVQGPMSLVGLPPTVLMARSSRKVVNLDR